MLSILIPVYNYNITSLVSELQKQAKETFADFEIIVMEDGSNEYLKENKEIEKLENCFYEVCNKNIGRSAIRNRLADKAKYEHLLFMDCDAEVHSPYFIEKYEAFCREECVVIGGTAYDAEESNPEFSLRLKYGRMREARPANERGKNNFATFNFLISKSIFNKVRFDETLKEYGHEDMLFGHELKRLNYEFIQIENPLIHKGLDNNEIFLKKTESATANLLRLYHSGKYLYLPETSKLLSHYLLVKKLHLTKIAAFKFNIFKNALKKQLTGKNPSLLLFDIYKLLYICKLSTLK
jgi:glycosyltransferase involved in cell wall biosynthesis